MLRLAALCFLSLFYTNYINAQSVSNGTVTLRPSQLSYPVQPSALFSRTVYYDANWKIVKRKDLATYYRPPVVKNGDRYEVEYYSMNDKRVKSGTYIPRIVNYQLSVEDGVGIKDGPFVFYDANGNKQRAGEYKNDLKQGEWKVYDNGRESTVHYSDDSLISK